MWNLVRDITLFDRQFFPPPARKTVRDEFQEESWKLFAQLRRKILSGVFNCISRHQKKISSLKVHKGDFSMNREDRSILEMLVQTIGPNLVVCDTGKDVNLSSFALKHLNPSVIASLSIKVDDFIAFDSFIRRATNLRKLQIECDKTVSRAHMKTLADALSSTLSPLEDLELIMMAEDEKSTPKFVSKICQSHSKTLHRIRVPSIPGFRSNGGYFDPRLLVERAWHRINEECITRYVVPLSRFEFNTGNLWEFIAGAAVLNQASGIFAEAADGPPPRPTQNSLFDAADDDADIFGGPMPPSAATRSSSASLWGDDDDGLTDEFDFFDFGGSNRRPIIIPIDLGLIELIPLFEICFPETEREVLDRIPTGCVLARCGLNARSHSRADFEWIFDTTFAALCSLLRHHSRSLHSLPPVSDDVLGLVWTRCKERFPDLYEHKFEEGKEILKAYVLHRCREIRRGPPRPPELVRQLLQEAILDTELMKKYGIDINDITIMEREDLYIYFPPCLFDCPQFDPLRITDWQGYPIILWKSLLQREELKAKALSRLLKEYKNRPEYIQEFESALKSDPELLESIKSSPELVSLIPII